MSNVTFYVVVPQVGYVALPSICGANSNTSWAVRGRLYQEAYMHGALGASHSRMALPCCIGSHYAVRTAALKKVCGGKGCRVHSCAWNGGPDGGTVTMGLARSFKAILSQYGALNTGGTSTF